MALGHAVVEMPLILIILYGFGTFFQYTLAQLALSILGGGVIIWMGVSLFRNRNAIIRGEKDTRYSSFVSGILMSGLNPFFLLWWFTVGSLWIMKFSVLGVTGMIVFIIVHWLCDLVWLTSVSNVIYRTHSFWKAGIQEWIFIGCGLILTGFGVWFIVSGVMLAIK